MYKFRTMRVSAQTVSDTVWTTSNDPRRRAWANCCAAPAWTSCPSSSMFSKENERGRSAPERPFFVTSSWRSAPLQSSPFAQSGITGWAQVCGWRGDTSIENELNRPVLFAELDVHIRSADSCHDAVLGFEPQERLLRRSSVFANVRGLSGCS